MDKWTAAAVGPYARAFRERERQRQGEVLRQRAALRERAQKAALALRCELGASDVWLFGSVAWGLPDSTSDIDLLVEGVAPPLWLQAALVAERAADHPVDVVLLQDAPGGLVERVRREGVLLHG